MNVKHYSHNTRYSYLQKVKTGEKVHIRNPCGMTFLRYSNGFLRVPNLTKKRNSFPENFLTTGREEAKKFFAEYFRVSFFQFLTLIRLIP